MERVLAVMATLAVGALIAFQPPVNSELGKHTSVLGAGCDGVARDRAYAGRRRRRGSHRLRPLIVSALLDRAGVLGLEQVGLTPLRLLGFVLLIAGTFLVVVRP
jgi:uncharacterized membrane protein YdcZ (DUF606 family)